MKNIALYLFLTCSAFARADTVYDLLRSDGEGFAQVRPDLSLSFPEDHLPHPQFRIEWWYLTANLTDSTGQEWGVHWTLFRQALRPETDPGGWQSTQAWMAHAALSTPNGHHYEERFARGGIDQAGVTLTESGRFDAWLDDWQLTGYGRAPLPGALRFTVNDYQVELELVSDRPWVLQGNEGYSLKSPSGQASAYYSQPHIQVTGQIRTGESGIRVSGLGWLDREWSSQPLAPEQPGWDWFSLHLDSGDALMVYQLRNTVAENTINGAWISTSGHSQTLTTGQIKLTPIRFDTVSTAEGPRRLPMAWRIHIPDRGLDVEVSAPQSEHWLATLFPYWEGPVNVQGSHGGSGYMELTGYSVID